MLCREGLLRGRILHLTVVVLLAAPRSAQALLSRRAPQTCDCPAPDPAASKGASESRLTQQDRGQASGRQARRIPRLVHQCWFPEDTPVPDRYLDWQRTWVTKHPDWEFWQWSDVSNRALVVRQATRAAELPAPALPG